MTGSLTIIELDQIRTFLLFIDSLLANLVGYMIALIAIFWGFMSSPRPERIQANHERAPQDKQSYIESHNAGDISQLVSSVKRGTYEKLSVIDDKSDVEEVCKTVREAEAEVHSDAKEAYKCILENYGGDHPLTARLADPSGGKLRMMKKRINEYMGTNTRWYGIDVTSSFAFLCLHYFDYIKDIGRLRHMSHVVNFLRRFRYLCDIGPL